jgi:hypothetical protein
MKTQTDCIYHCLICGRIERSAVKTEVPACCGQTMTQSCLESVPTKDGLGPRPPGLAEAPAADQDRPPKPR